MQMTTLAKISGPVLRVWKEHDTAILTAVTMAASGAAVVFALQDGPKCREILAKKRAEDATNAEKAKAILPVAGRTMMAIAVAWGAALLNHKRTRDKIGTLVEAAAVGYSLYGDTKKKVEEECGPEVAEKIEKEVMVKHAVSKPVAMSEIEETGHGNFIFREPMTGKTFRASKDYVRLIVQEWSEKVHIAHNQIKNGELEEFKVTMTDIFRSFPLSHCGFGDLFEWDAEYDDEIIVNLDNTFDYEGPDGTKEPAYILDFYTKPTLACSSYSSQQARNY